MQICNWRKSQLFHILLITPLNIVSKMFLTAANCIWREPNFHIVMNVSGDLSDCHNKQFISFLPSWCWHKRLQCCQMIFLVWWPRIPTSKAGRWPRKGCPCYYNIWCYYNISCYYKHIMLLWTYHVISALRKDILSGTTYFKSSRQFLVVKSLLVIVYTTDSQPYFICDKVLYARPNKSRWDLIVD